MLLGHASQKNRPAMKPKAPNGVLGLSVGVKFIVRRNKKTAWHWPRGADRVTRLRNGHPSNRKGELPMELTAKLTMVSAIVSFSFLAAVILGMI
jgi:hypothetical protein